MIFGFSLYIVPLLATLVTYLGSRLGKLSRLRLLGDSKICHYQYWKKVLVLVNFQNKLIQCKLLDYILNILSVMIDTSRMHYGEEQRV